MKGYWRVLIEGEDKGIIEGGNWGQSSRVRIEGGKKSSRNWGLDSKLCSIKPESTSEEVAGVLVLSSVTFGRVAKFPTWFQFIKLKYQSAWVHFAVSRRSCMQAQWNWKWAFEAFLRLTYCNLHYMSRCTFWKHNSLIYDVFLLELYHQWTKCQSVDINEEERLFPL